MAEKKQNNTKFDKKKLDDYSSFIKKYILKLLELDTDLYFFVFNVLQYSNYDLDNYYYCRFITCSCSCSYR